MRSAQNVVWQGGGLFSAGRPGPSPMRHAQTNSIVYKQFDLQLYRGLSRPFATDDRGQGLAKQTHI